MSLALRGVNNEELPVHTKDNQDTDCTNSKRLLLCSNVCGCLVFECHCYRMNMDDIVCTLKQIHTRLQHLETEHTLKCSGKWDSSVDWEHLQDFTLRNTIWVVEGLRPPLGWPGDCRQWELAKRMVGWENIRCHRMGENEIYIPEDWTPAEDQ